jgi:hypothetical protein
MTSLERFEEFKELIEKGLSGKDIARMLRVSTTYVTGMKIICGFPVRKGHPRKAPK